MDAGTPPSQASPTSTDPVEVSAFRAARGLVLDRIARAAERAGRDPAAIGLVAVSKTVGPPRVRAAVAAGLAVLGENRVQEGEDKRGLVGPATWHLIGPLQSNKVRRAVAAFAVIQSVDSLELARRIDRLVADVRGAGMRLPVFLQVNVDEDPAKAGHSPDRLAADLPELASLAGLELLGLMTIGRLVAEPGEARPTFVALRRLSERLRADVPALGPGLSMGMSADFEVAVEEGATLVRVGRALFGDRSASEAGGVG
ncbi:MAG TPA: YggS family pyridoxal phosphate-dependent enzyme [Candidatus Limnocylindrales bacterium]